MRRTLPALTALCLSLASAAWGQSSPSQWPLASLPLTGQDAVLLDQGSGCATHTLPCATVQAPSTRVGQPLAQATPPTNAFPFQIWWDISSNPAVYKVYNGSTWVPVYAADTTTGIPSFPGNVFLPSGNLTLGTTTVTGNYRVTIFGQGNQTTNGVVTNSYGGGGPFPHFSMFGARGTLAAPTAVQTDDLIGSLRGSGFWSGKPNPYFIPGDSRAGIDFHAAENWISPSNNGTYIEIGTTPLGGTTDNQGVFISPEGFLGVGVQPNFGVTLSRNNPIPSAGVSQGYTFDTYENGSGLVGGGFRGFTARGTAASPTAVVTNDTLLELSASGFWTGKTNGFWSGADGRASLKMLAAENFSGSSNNGTYMTFSVTATAAGTQTERMRLNASGGLGIGTITDPGVNNLLTAGVIMAGATDVGLSRTAAATLALGNGTAGNATGKLKLASVAHQCTVFASAPGSPVQGQTACFTDSNTVTWGATIAGGSSNAVLAFFNGSNWTVVGK